MKGVPEGARRERIAHRQSAARCESSPHATVQEERGLLHRRSPWSRRSSWRPTSDDLARRRAPVFLGENAGEDAHIFDPDGKGGCGVNQQRGVGLEPGACRREPARQSRIWNYRRARPGGQERERGVAQRRGHRHLKGAAQNQQAIKRTGAERAQAGFRRVGDAPAELGSCKVVATALCQHDSETHAGPKEQTVESVRERLQQRGTPVRRAALSPCALASWVCGEGGAGATPPASRPSAAARPRAATCSGVSP